MICWQRHRHVTVTSPGTLSAIVGGNEGGDIVDGLQAAITPNAIKVRPGDDTLIDFALHLADPGKAKPGRSRVWTQKRVAAGHELS